MKKYFKIALYLAIIGLVAIVSINYYVKSSTKSHIYYSVKKFPKNDVGIIEVKDATSYVAINRKKVPDLLKKLNGQKVKNKKVKMQIAY